MDAHHHECPRCHEREECYLDCTPEPDLGVSKNGLPFGGRELCARCAPTDEQLAKAIARCRDLVHAIRDGAAQHPELHELVELLPAVLDHAEECLP